METRLIVYDIIRFGFFGIFTGLHALLMLGLVLEWLRDRRVCRMTNAAEPLVSVVIPVRNEIKRMDGMLKTIANQNYRNFELIFVNDRSTDGTEEKLREYIRCKTGMHILSLTENPGPNYKQYALGRGIAFSRGDFILLTDSDCEFPPHWISSMVKRMADPQTGAMLGPVFKKSGGRGFFHLYQCFEHAVRYMYLAASTGIGAAGGGFGNNLILRRKSLDAIGGYDSIPVSQTEDAALICRIRAKSKYKIRAGMGTDLHVITQGEDNWKKFITQTLRWNNGGLFSPDLAARFNFSFLMITISTGIIAIPFLPFIPSLWPFSLAVLISMTANTIATLILFGVSLPKKGIAYALQCVFTPMYFTFLTILGYCGIRPKWKE